MQTLPMNKHELGLTTDQEKVDFLLKHGKVIALAPSEFYAHFIDLPALKTFMAKHNLFGYMLKDLRDNTHLFNNRDLNVVIIIEKELINLDTQYLFKVLTLHPSAAKYIYHNPIILFNQAYKEFLEFNFNLGIPLSVVENKRHTAVGSHEFDTSALFAAIGTATQSFSVTGYYHEVE